MDSRDLIAGNGGVSGTPGAVDRQALLPFFQESGASLGPQTSGSLDPGFASLRNSRDPLPSASYKYTGGDYLEKNPSWHVEESPFKAKHILRLLKHNGLTPRTVCEAGCGAGEVLRQLQQEMDPACEFWGYDISPIAHEFSKPRENEKLHFRLGHPGKDDGTFDLLLLDVVEHVEDYFAFLRQLWGVAQHVVLHFPLDLSVQAVMRKNGLMNRRENHGHLHYFSKELELQTLRDTGYQIEDWTYLARSNEIGKELPKRILTLPRAALFTIHKDWAARILGGYSLLVLAK